jgi:hypothetical protein
MSVTPPFVTPLENFFYCRSRRGLPHFAKLLNRFSGSLSTCLIPVIARVERSTLAVDSYRLSPLDLVKQGGHIGSGICKTDIFHGAVTP